MRTFTGGTSWSRAGLVLVLYLTLATAGWVWSSLQGHVAVWRAPGRDDPQTWLGAAAGALMGLGVVFLSRLAVHRLEWARSLHRDLRARLGPLGDLECLVLAGASAVGEEVFFRGALLPAVGLVWSNLVFAALHVGPRVRHLPWTVSSFVVGVLFGQLFLWSGSLAGPVLAHFVVNFMNLRHLSRQDLP